MFISLFCGYGKNDDGPGTGGGGQCHDHDPGTVAWEPDELREPAVGRVRGQVEEAQGEVLSGQGPQGKFPNHCHWIGSIIHLWQNSDKGENLSSTQMNKVKVIE